MKIFNDPVHGHIELPDICIQIIDTRQFQRLRQLKQLGVSYYVYYGACHNRFEHSIGVCYLATCLLDHLSHSQPELGISERDYRCVQVAALCHDLGHGPFSHLFDGHFMPIARPESGFKHEDASQRMLDFLVRENDIPLSLDELAFIKDLINGEPTCDASRSEKQFLFDIVANKRNSVDVDKFDYIIRDCKHVGIRSAVDALRLIKFTRVVGNQICFNQKEVFNLYEMFHSRYTLFKRVYTHRVSTAIEFMIRDILLEADAVLGVSKSVDDMSQYVLLDDSILNEIARSRDPRLEKAKLLLNRLHRRNLYRAADQVIIPPDMMGTFSHDMITEAKIVDHQSSGTALKETDIIVEYLYLNYAFKDKNPVDSIRFFSKHSPNENFQITKDEVSSFIPKSYKEVIVRVFAKDENKSADIQLAFRNLIDHLNAGFEDYSNGEPLHAQSQGYAAGTEAADFKEPSSTRSSPSKGRLVPTMPLESPRKPREKLTAASPDTFIKKNPFLVDGDKSDHFIDGTKRKRLR